MPTKQDFGLYLSELGADSDVEIDVYDVHVNHMMFLNDSLLTVARGSVVGDQVLPVFYDFETRFVADLHARATSEVQEEIEAGLEGIISFPHNIELSTPIVVSLKATLGDLQAADDEPFVPLVVQAVK